MKTAKNYVLGYLEQRNFLGRGRENKYPSLTPFLSSDALLRLPLPRHSWDLEGKGCLLMSSLEPPRAQNREWFGQHWELANTGTLTKLAIYYFLWLKVPLKQKESGLVHRGYMKKDCMSLLILQAIFRRRRLSRGLGSRGSFKEKRKTSCLPEARA